MMKFLSERKLQAMNQQDRDALEALIDRTNLSTVLEAIGDICHGKSQRLVENWQDRFNSPQERYWRVMGRNINTVRDTAETSERDLKIYRGAA